MSGGRERPRRALRTGVLLSGTGRTLENLIERTRRGELDLDFRVVISDREGVRGLDVASEAGIPVLCIPPRDAGSGFSRRVTEALASRGVELVLMAGFLSLWRIPPELEGRVLNIHPSLLPAFGGKGYYTDRVHRAALARGVKLSGCTVHFADNEYDAGPIVLQEAVPVLDDDTPETLAARVFEKECELYPRAVRLFGEGRLRIEGHRVRILERAGPDARPAEPGDSPEEIRR